MKTGTSLSPAVKKIIIIITGLVLLSGIVLGVLLGIRSKKSEVNVFSVASLQLNMGYGYDNSETQGTVYADNIQSVYVSKTQLVKEVYVKEGDSVKVGDKLMSFDTTLSDIELKRQEIKIGQLELELKQAQDYQRQVNTYVVGTYVPPVSDVPYMAPGYRRDLNAAEAEDLQNRNYNGPVYSSGIGVLTNPFIYVWNDSQVAGDEDIPFTDSFIAGIRSDLDFYQHKYAAASAAYEATNDESYNPLLFNGNPGTADTYPMSAYVVFERRENNSYDAVATKGYGAVYDSFMLVFTWTDANTCSFIITDVPESYDPDDPELEEEIDTTVYISSQAALNQLKQEAQEKIDTLTTDLKTANYRYSLLEYELTNGVVLSKVNGSVQLLNDVEEVSGTDTPAMLVSGGGGYYINGVLSENELGLVKVGDSVNVMSWMTGQSYGAVITEISQFPVGEAESGNYYHSSNGNRNVSLYPFTAMIDESAALREGESLSISYTPGSTEESGFYIENMFVRTENGRPYVMAVGQNGLLEKRYVTTGGTLWGSYTKILSGLTSEDFIAFPYGKAVKEGSRVKESSVDVLYQY